MISITDLLQAVTADQAQATFVQALVGLGVPADKWRKGGSASSILRVIAITYAGFSSTLVAGLSSGFLPYASGGWLILLAYYVYGVTANPATFASGQVTLTNTGGGSFTYLANQVTFVNSKTKQSYTNAAGFTLNPLSTLTGLQITARTAGAIGSANPGDIDTIQTSMLSVTVSNPAAVVGQDAESDPALRTRCTNKLAALSVRGPRNAYAWAVTSALRPDGTPVNINRVQVITDSSTGNVTIYCASPSGAPTSLDLQYAAASVETLVRPSGFTVTVLAAATVAYAPAITVYAQAAPGVVASDLQTAAASAIATFLSVYPVGGLATDVGASLFGSGVQAIIGQTVPAVVSIEGAVDLLMSAGQVATDSVSVSVRLVQVS